ncbi:TPA: TrbG/VirB9 family P-type conjugative transfer protein [Campylobacter fetus subsp. venerealis]|nr:TrbG/VirB9 family P-type conjugative transfer protein [Campylobacter fetus subsp. venerealis]HDX6258439.1 TrbG/VirB9 family P-type conjugative transfer protein [Campylobacter fetus subsp. venerealis]HDX6262331.1 TrbG/VirB9 family P-type conjugative transfer protein [Campylobacter fetus subsp. venerealis]HDX6264349.1 TrbG/VirB9 family P-type conjugative transfer protein [Campylobacter fetus subsp. venerealis]HDX6266226.1 TrbG/VirB9 family P-type conjugative transfer protein [Campylobacter fet
MKKLIKLSLITIITLNLNAEQQVGLSEAQMNEVRTIMRQTQELVNEQQQNSSMGEDIFNEKNKNINSQMQSNFKINPFGMGQNSHPQLTKFNSQQPQIVNQDVISMEQTQELSKEELELMRNAIRNQDLKALQNKFHSKKYSGYENTQTIKYTPNKTHKIRTRHAMATTLIFDSEIDNFVLGDQTGFKVEQISSKANAIAIIPQLIGIDTSLTIFTNDGKIHTFYIFSTDYKNTNDPSFVIHIQDDEFKQAQLAKAKADSQEYKIIKDGIAELKIKKSDIYSGYAQKAKKENEWLLSAEIFDDKKFTYFKYPKNELPQVPAIFAVIDNQDSPVETRVIGDYVIAETINPKFTIKSGDSYVCVSRKETQEEINRKEIRKNLNIDKETIKQREIKDSKIITKNQEKHNEAINKVKGILE